MSKYMSKENFKAAIPAAFAVLLIAVSRLLPHPWNFTPVCAAAIFGGIYFNRKVAILLPVASMFAADLIIGISWPDLPFVYGALVVAALIGGWAGNARGRFPHFIVKTYSGTLASSLLFFVITNFGAWLTLDMYAKDFQGLLASYLMGVPFFKSTLAGDLIFITLFVTAYEMVYRLTLAKPRTVSA
jgi:hypothetical protein